jgi:hypothetical protein
MLWMVNLMYVLLYFIWPKHFFDFEFSISGIRAGLLK